MTDLSDRTLPGDRGHLDDEVISALLDDELSAPERARAVGHRAGCARCRDRSDQLGRAATMAATAPPRPALAGGELAVAAALASARTGARFPPVALGTPPLTSRSIRPGGPMGWGRWPERPTPPVRRRARVLVGVVVVAAAGLAAGGLHGGAAPAAGGRHGGAAPAVAVRSLAQTSSLGSFPSTASLRATLEATVASIDTSGPASTADGTGSVPCHEQASRAAELAAATAAVPAASGAAGPEAAFAAPVELSKVPAEVFTFPRLATAGVDGSVTRVGTFAVVVEDGTCAVVARLGW